MDSTAVAPVVNAQSEEWRFISDFIGRYSVSGLGRVYSHARNGTGGRFLAPVLNHGKHRIYLCDSGATRAVSLHLLVLEAFHGSRSVGAQPVWLDGNPLNCRADNLRWSQVAPVADAEFEEWRWIAGFIGRYSVSSLGRVYSQARNGTGGQFLKTSIYHCRNRVYLSRECCTLAFWVHDFVLQAFHGPCPDGARPVWLDGDQLNCTAANLCWSEVG